MVKDLTNDNGTLKTEIYKDMTSRVDNFVSNGGIISDDRRIYLDYNTQNEYIKYYRYKNMRVRFNAYVNKYKKEPKSIQIMVNPSALDNTGANIPISQVLDAEARIKAYTGPINDSTHVYFDMTTMLTYVSYSTMKDMLARKNAFVKKNNRLPNYVSTNAGQTGQSSALIATKDCYKSPRWYSGTEMKQDTNYYCGCNMTQQILREITGNYYSESYLARLLGTTKRGTGPNEIVAVIKKLLTQSGYKVKKCEWVYKSDLSWDEIGKLIENKNVGLGLHCLYKNQYGHYEYPIKLCKSSSTITIAQSLSGGYLQQRSFSTMLQYINGITGKSILIVEVE